MNGKLSSESCSYEYNAQRSGVVVNEVSLDECGKTLNG